MVGSIRLLPLLGSVVGPKLTAGFGSLSGPIVVLGEDHGMSEEMGNTFSAYNTHTTLSTHTAYLLHVLLINVHCM